VARQKQKVIDAAIDNGAPIADWTIKEEMQINGRHVVKGTELKIKGERGRFRFVKYVYNEKLDVDWIDVWGGPKKMPAMRSFRIDRVQRVHYKNTTQEALAEEYKIKKQLLKEERENSV